MKYESKLKKLLFLIENKYKIYLFIFIFLLFFASFLQIVGINSLLPTVASFFDNKYEIENEYFNVISNYISSITGASIFLSLLTLTVIIIIFSNIIFILVIYFTSKLAYFLEREIKLKISKNLINLSFENLIKFEKEKTISMYTLETQRFAILINSYADIASRIILIFFLIIYLIIFFPKVLLILFFLSLFYFIIFKIIRKKITDNSNKLSKINENTINIIYQLFSGFRELKIFNLENLFVKKFSIDAVNLNKIRFFNSFFSSSPRYFLEIIIFIFILIIIPILNFDENTQVTLGKSAVLFFIFFKLLPLIQGLFAQIIATQANINSIDIIYNFMTQHRFKENINLIDDNVQNTKKNFIKLNYNNLEYKINDRQILKKINLEILKGDIIGLVGESGIGKTILLDVLLGFRKPNKGEIFLNNNKLELSELLKFFKNNGSIVSQTGSAFNDTVLYNITLESKIIEKRLDKILDICLLEKLYDVNGEINEFYKRNISKLSGGQIQRVLMARSLYKGSEFLVIDEGLNQLDIENEVKLFQNLSNLGITILMVYHRITKIEHFDRIYKLENGKLEQINVNKNQ